MIAAALLSAGCHEIRLPDSWFVVDDNYSRDGSTTYDLLKVIQKDPNNPGGIDIKSKLDFLSTFTMTLYHENGRLVAAEFDNGDVLFPPTADNQPLPSGKVDVEFDDKSVPNVMREKASGRVLATFIRGQFYMPFQLDNAGINYEFWFKLKTE